MSIIEDLPLWAEAKRKPKTGAEARDQGIAKVTEHNEEWVEMAVLEIQRLVREKTSVTADDIRHLELPHPNCAGAAFRIAASRKLIQPQGYTMAKTVSCHSRLVRVWKAA